MAASEWRWLWLGVILAGSFVGASRTCLADDNSCGGESKPSTYHAQPGDVSDSTSLDVSRSVAGTDHIEINVCNGELRIEPAWSAERASALRVQVSSPGADQNLARYLQDFEVSGGKAIVSVRIPGKYHAIVTITVPEQLKGGSQVNLGAGTLLLHEDRLKGDWQANVGAGKLMVFLNGDMDYATLQANVGMGRFKDERPGGGNRYTVISRSMSGSGAGKVELNVGAGEIDLEPAGK